MTMKAPTGWVSYDSIFRMILMVFAPTGTYHPMVTQENTLVHSGTSAAKLSCTLQDDTSVYQGIMANGTINVTDPTDPDMITVEGGLYVSDRIQKVSAWLRYDPKHADEAAGMTVMGIQDGTAASGGDSILGTGVIMLKGTTPYTHFDCNLVYPDPTVKPDRIVIMFIGGSGDTVVDGSALYVDDVTMTSVTGIETPIFSNETINIYPNPATDVLHINTSVKINTRFSIYSVTGRLIQQKELQGNTDIAINELPAGAYIYQLHTQDGATQLFQGSFIKK
jgi:hypothetical protein